MGLKKEEILRIANPAFGTGVGGQSLAVIGTGLKTIVPAPPAGFLRFFDPFVSRGMQYMVGPLLRASDGSAGVLPIGTFDGQIKIGGIDVGPALFGEPDFNATQIPVYLTASESLQLDVTAFGGGADRLVGLASWKDFPVNGAVQLRPVVLDTNPIDIIPTVPAGKYGMAYSDGNLSGLYLHALVDNRDTVFHGFRIAIVNPDGSSIAVTYEGFGAGSRGVIQTSGIPRIPAGAKVTIAMDEPMVTTAPRVYCGYTYLDA